MQGNLLSKCCQLSYPVLPLGVVLHMGNYLACCAASSSWQAGQAGHKARELCAQCAHIMAMAVQKLHPRIQVTIGPWIERGFYYDFDTPEDERLIEADLKVIKKEMQRIIKADLPFTCEEVRCAFLVCITGHAGMAAG